MSHPPHMLSSRRDEAVTASNPRAINRWKNEGGAAALPEDMDQNAILQHLGAAVLTRLSSLPREIQSDLFNAAVQDQDPETGHAVIRQHIAVFLHQHKDAQSRSSQ